MEARVGDRLVVRGHRAGETGRTATVIELHGERGAPPYKVRWDADGHESLVFPGSDVSIEYAGDAPAAAPARHVGAPHEAAHPALGDHEVRIAAAEEGLDALRAEVETLREDLRALAAAVGERSIAT